MSKSKIEIRDIGLSGIAVTPGRMRLLRDGVVREIANSIKEIGLLNPVTVRSADIGYYLVAGRHRLEAVRSLGLSSILCRVLADDVSEDDARLAEIDENLARADLSPAERAAHIDARKQIYESLHPTTKHGGAPGKAGGGKTTKDAKYASFADDTAEKTGQSKRKVQQDAKRGKDIPDVGSLSGTSLDKGDELDALAKLPSHIRETLMLRARRGDKVSAKAELKKLARQEREKNLATRQAALPNKRYGVIYADPEWRFEPYSRDTGMDRAADNHYPTSKTDVIASRPIKDIAADDCVLFLWATAPMLPDALWVMESWGFEYKTHCIWAKDRIGTGYWFRNQHELLLVGVRGQIPAPAMGTQIESLVDAPTGKHSEKPVEFYDLIESYFPNLPKIELNARTARPGWDAWGYEAPGETKAA